MNGTSDHLDLLDLPRGGVINPVFALQWNIVFVIV